VEQDVNGGSWEVDNGGNENRLILREVQYEPRLGRYVLDEYEEKRKNENGTGEGKKRRGWKEKQRWKEDQEWFG
jgi:hypothetical protein